MLPINSHIIIIIIHPLNVASVAQDYEHYYAAHNAVFNIGLKQREKVPGRSSCDSGRSPGAARERSHGRSG